MAPGSRWHGAGSIGCLSGRLRSGSRWHEAGSTGGRSGRMTSGSHWHEAGSTGSVGILWGRGGRRREACHVRIERCERSLGRRQLLETAGKELGSVWFSQGRH